VGAEEKLGGKMDSMEPEQTPFAAVSAHTSRLTRVSLRLIPLFSRVEIGLEMNKR
jgi:hypothetical protein